MKISNFNTVDRVFIIAEIGNNHEGNYSLAEEMIGLAARAGADAVKFQTIVPEKLVSVLHKDRVKQLNNFQLSYNEFSQLEKVAKNEKVIFLSTPFDINSAIFLNELVPVYKISSGDNTFYPLIEVIAKTAKPIIMSTGLIEINGIRNTTNYINKIWKENRIKQELALLHCVSSYPTKPENANLSAIHELKDIVDVVGYSDHTLGIEAAILSVALGARIIEKHFTIDNNYSDFHDHKLSANPSNFKLMVEKIREAEILIGAGKKTLSLEGLDNKINIRRSIVAKNDIDIGHTLTIEDLDWVRPGGGISPGQEKIIIGKKLKRNINKGTVITNEELI